MSPAKLKPEVEVNGAFHLVACCYNFEVRFRELGRKSAKETERNKLLHL